MRHQPHKPTLYPYTTLFRSPGTMVAAVTVLTSLGDDDLGRIGLSGPVPDAVLRLAVLSVEAGAQGLVCSPRSEEHTSELQSHVKLVCRLPLEKRKSKAFA